jgi:hypothetical protein
MTQPARYLTATVVQGLEISLMRARALQEGADTVAKALNGHNVHHPLLSTQEDRQAALSKHGNGPHVPIVQDEPGRSCSLRGSHQLRQVHLERVFEDRHSGRFGCFHLVYLKEKRTGHLHARFMAGLRGQGGAVQQ